MATIVVASDPEAAGLDDVRAAAAGRAELVFATTPDALATWLPRAQGVLAWDHHLYGSLADAWPLAGGPHWLHCKSAGVDALLSSAVVASPATLTNSRGVFSVALAEFALGAIFYFAKRMRRMIDDHANRRWQPFEIARVQGSVLGVCGLGSVGQAVAATGQAFGMRVLAARRDPGRGSGEGIVDRVYGPAELPAMLAACDHVVLCLPLTPATRRLIGAAELAAMKPGAHLINIGRGEVVDEAALAAALRVGLLGGAALDVYEIEPLPPDSPLYGLDNVLLSPHCADNTPDVTRACVEVFRANLARFLAGAPLLNVVDKAAGY